MSYIGKNPKLTSITLDGYADFAAADSSTKRQGRFVLDRALDNLYYDDGTSLILILKGTSHAGLTLTNASIEGPSRLDVKQDTEANLINYALTATNGQLCFATNTKKMYQVIDNLLEDVGGGAISYWQKALSADLASDGTIGDLAVSGLTIGQKYEVTVNVKAIRTATDVNEIQELNFSAIPTYGKWQLEWDGQTTAEMGFDYSAAEIQAEVDALSNITPSSDLIVTGAWPTFTFTFGNTKAAANQPEITIPFNTLVTGETGGTDEVQEIIFSGTPTSGNWSITFNGNTTQNMAYNANAATVQAQLENLPGINSVTVVDI